MRKKVWIAQSFDWESRQVLGVFSTKEAAEARTKQYLENCIDTVEGHECVEVTWTILDATFLTDEEESSLSGEMVAYEDEKFDEPA